MPSHYQGQQRGEGPANRLLSAYRKGRTGRMTHFLGTHQNKLDAKGRVSVPAAFRAALRQNGDNNGNGSRNELSGNPSNGNCHGTPLLVLRPSHKHPCVEAWPPAEFRALSEPLDRYDLFSEEHDDLANTLFANAYPVEADREGRIVLPDVLIAHAGLGESVIFMGLGRIFQIWEPQAAERRMQEARERARSRGLTLRSSGAQ
jgi:MraZ protein